MDKENEKSFCEHKAKEKILLYLSGRKFVISDDFGEAHMQVSEWINYKKSS